MRKGISLSLLLIILILCVISTVGCHSHSYITTVAKESTCETPGIITYSCSCGESFDLENEKLKEHTFAPATCVSPEICQICGLEKGEKSLHNFKNNICTICNKLSINLTIDSSIRSINYISPNNEIVVCKISKIEYQTNYNKDYRIELTVYWSGEKEHNSSAPNSITSCYIGYALYDADGYIVDCGFDRTINLRGGDKFRNEYFVINNLSPNQNYTLTFFDYK